MTIEYHVYSNTGNADPVNYAVPVATVAGTSWTSAGLSPGEWSFGVRAFDTATGLEEQNVDAAATVDVGASGQDLSLLPLPPVGLLVTARAAGTIRVDWSYPIKTDGSAPTGFNVYIGTGGSPSYVSPAASISASSGLLARYSVTLSGLTNGTTYNVGVRAFNATGEEQNTVSVAAVAKTVGPNAVVGLFATTIV